MKINNQKKCIKMHLIKNGSITQYYANKKYGISRLSAVIYLLRQEGMKIITSNKKVKTRFWGITTVAEYKLVGGRIK